MRNLLPIALLIAACSHDVTNLADTDCQHDYVPNVGAPSACCRSQVECDHAAGNAGRYCTPPGTEFFCPTCDATTSCDTDAECKTRSPTLICEPVQCACAPLVTHECVAGCTTNAVCAAGEACDLASGRCGPAACATAVDCPVDFFCGASGCERLGCTFDDECSAFCVRGQCYDTAGECRGPIG
jgi:hypothetical protein